MKMIPFEVSESVKIKRTRDSEIQTEEDIEFVCTKCLNNRGNTPNDIEFLSKAE